MPTSETKERDPGYVKVACFTSTYTDLSGLPERDLGIPILGITIPVSIERMCTCAQSK